MDTRLAAVIVANPELERRFIARFEAYEMFYRARDKEMWEQIGIQGVAFLTAYLQWRTFYKEHGTIHKENYNDQEEAL